VVVNANSPGFLGEAGAVSILLKHFIIATLRKLQAELKAAYAAGDTDCIGKAAIAVLNHSMKSAKLSRPFVFVWN
jgi:hypothetical protein